jgi:UDP-glucose 4-epimerase
MRILVTGARGKVGRATVARCLVAGHDVTALDITPPVFERPAADEADYVQADLTDAGQVFAVVARGFDAIVHAAAIPEPTRNPPQVVFHNNLMGVFNVVESAVRFGVGRVVNLSSETVPGYFFPERPFLPDYLPMDEEHPVRPQDPYALAKSFGEQICDAAVRRSDLRCISIRPSWVQWEGNYAGNLGPQLRDPDEPSAGFWGYIDADDLADALLLAAECDVPDHEVIYIASPDIASTHTLPELLARHHGEGAIELRDLPRPDAGPISIEKARRLLGYDPQRSWRDHLDEQGNALAPS